MSGESMVGCAVWWESGEVEGDFLLGFGKTMRLQLLSRPMHGIHLSHLAASLDKSPDGIFTSPPVNASASLVVHLGVGQAKTLYTWIFGFE